MVGKRVQSVHVCVQLSQVCANLDVLAGKRPPGVHVCVQMGQVYAEKDAYGRRTGALVTNREVRERNP
jgi:hypothetical protein